MTNGCTIQYHAGQIRELINQKKNNSNPNYCVRVTANDGKIGEQFLRDFQDNEKTIPTILTTSQKLSTGVDARNIRNIVLLRPVNSMIEFKQIIGRGTRTFDGKDFFTIYDFVGAYKHFADPEWDGEPIDANEDLDTDMNTNTPPQSEIKITKEKDEVDSDTKLRTKVKIKLRDGKEREIGHMISTSFWSMDGKPISAEEFLNALFGTLPELFKNEDELRVLWGNPITRQKLLEQLTTLGYDADGLTNLQRLINAEHSDLFDVLEYVFNSDIKPITRIDRVSMAKLKIYAIFDEKQQEFINFVLDKYIESGVHT